MAQLLTRPKVLQSFGTLSPALMELFSKHFLFRVLLEHANCVPNELEHPRSAGPISSSCDSHFPSGSLDPNLLFSSVQSRMQTARAAARKVLERLLR